MIVLRSRGTSLSTVLREEKSSKKLGSTTKCFELRDLFRISVHGCTPNEHAHLKECQCCRTGYGNYMKIRRNEGRMELGLDPYEDIVERVFGVRSK